MKVVEIGAFGLSGLKVTERPKPDVQPGTVLVRVRAASLNYRDLMVALGHYNPKMKLPRIPCSDGAGEVVEVGAGVEGVKVGDRVAGTFFQSWTDGEQTEAGARSALGGDLDGMLSEYVLLAREGFVHVPEHMSFEEGATLPCAALTAWHSLVEKGGVKPGDTVLVQGTGGVSLFGLQIARLAGARVIATSSSDEKLERALALGASDGINYQTHPKWDERVRELTGGLGVDHIVEVGGAGTLGLSFRSVRRGGNIGVIGVLTGNAEVNPMPILMRGIRVQGIYVGSRKMFENMNRAFALARTKPVIDRTFALSEIQDALLHMQGGRHFGKIVIEL